MLRITMFCLASADMHTHIAFDGTPYAWSMNSLFKEKTAFRAVKAVWEAYKHLRSGFTTIRDLGSMDYIDIGVREAIIKGLVVGPNIYTSGKALSMTGGHGDLWVRDDVSGPTFGLIVNGVESVRFATRMLVRQGADWIKFWGQVAWLLRVITLILHSLRERSYSCSNMRRTPRRGRLRFTLTGRLGYS